MLVIYKLVLQALETRQELTTQSVRNCSRLAVYLKILDEVNDEGLAIPSHIIQKANLSHDRLMEFVGELFERELIAMEELHGNRSFSLKSKGRTVLEQMKITEDFLSSYDLT